MYRYESTLNRQEESTGRLSPTSPESTKRFDIYIDGIPTARVSGPNVGPPSVN